MRTRKGRKVYRFYKPADGVFEALIGVDFGSGKDMTIETIVNNQFELLGYYISGRRC